ncbi:MAG TPA: TIM-barrel domain-containing protein, partial [Pyrinomonadaceae bacterium]|nr:TIM-barrel domain-containing protein [Pyrinomonadaceae bacterium]
IDVIRIRLSPAGRFERDFSYAIDYSVDRHSPITRLSQTAAQVIISNVNNTRVVVRRAPFSIGIFDDAGNLIIADDAARPVIFDRSTGEIQAAKLRNGEVETYYGFGEKAFAEMSRNGKHIVNWNTDTFSYPVGTDPIYQSIPFFYALRDGKAYGLFFNNTFRTWFDMGKTSPHRYSFGADGGELDYFLFTGGKQRSPKKVLEDYSHLTGRTPLPPMWALGNHQSRWSYFPEKRVREIADGFRSRKIPLDVIHLDIDYMDGYRVFTWDKTRFPNPKKLVSDLKDDGIQTVLIIDPGIKVDAKYDTYADGKREGMFVKDPDGSELNRNVWPQASAFPDFTDPRAREWFGARLKPHIDEDVAGFWTDMNEPGVFLTERTAKPDTFHHPDKTFPYDTPHKGDGHAGTHKRYHNVYGMQMARSTFEGVQKLRPEKRPFVLTRAGFAGVQRFSAVWSGDNYASWDHLAMTIPLLTNLSVSGVAFIGSDVGGFNDRPSGELYTRWLQASILTPFLRSHSVGWAGNKEPWEYGDEFTPINRRMIELRYQFLPYLYTLFYEHERTGQPVMRPLWYEFPNDRLTYLIGDEYMAGSDVLVAPIVKEGMRHRDLYLPAGANWVNWWTGELLEGGKQHRVDAPLDRFPLFIRAGAVVPTQSTIQHTGLMKNAPLTLNVAVGVAAGKTETATIHQDAGEGYGYRRSEWRRIGLEHSSGSLKISRVGNFPGQRIRYIEAVGLAASPREVRADGVKIEHTYSAQTRRLRVEIPENAGEITLVR